MPVAGLRCVVGHHSFAVAEQREFTAELQNEIALLNERFGPLWRAQTRTMRTLHSPASRGAGWDPFKTVHLRVRPAPPLSGMDQPQMPLTMQSPPLNGLSPLFAPSGLRVSTPKARGSAERLGGHYAKRDTAVYTVDSFLCHHTMSKSAYEKFDSSKKRREVARNTERNNNNRIPITNSSTVSCLRSASMPSLIIHSGNVKNYQTAL